MDRGGWTHGVSRSASHTRIGAWLVQWGRVPGGVMEGVLKKQQGGWGKGLRVGGRTPVLGTWPVAPWARCSRVCEVGLGHATGAAAGPRAGRCGGPGSVLCRLCCSWGSGSRPVLTPGTWLKLTRRPHTSKNESLILSGSSRCSRATAIPRLPSPAPLRPASSSRSQARAAVCRLQLDLGPRACVARLF